jgi:RNA polymerase sigma-70 factor (ECF subfamily)
MLTSQIPRMRSYARSLVGDQCEADDLVQECLSRALARARIWVQVQNARAYLLAMLHNLYIDRVAKNHLKSVPLEDVAQWLTTAPDQEDRLRVRDLVMALDCLPNDQRQVVLLVGFEGLSYQEAASVLRVPLGTVMSRLFRGREALRRIIDGVRTAPASARSGRCLVGSVGIGVKVRGGGGRDEPYQQAI